MRIIAGKYKGHKLVAFDQGHIRPTTDRVKESLFNILAPVIDGARVLDLYSGTGNLGIEAYSRGAREVTAVEINFKSIKIIQRNLELLKIQDGIEIVKTSAIDYLNEYSGEPYEIVLVDPPFPALICLNTLEAAAKSEALGPSSRLAIEHSKRELLPDKVGALTRIDSRNYGDKLLSFYSRITDPKEP